MPRASLLLLLVSVWFFAPELALALGDALDVQVSTRAVTYRANGILAAVMCLLAREAHASAPYRATCDAAAYFWVAQPVCDVFWLTEGVNTASVCDSAFSIPGTAFASAGIAALAGWIYDRHG